MHRKIRWLCHVLPEWFTTVVLSIPFTLKILSLTQDDLPVIFLAVLVNTTPWGAVPAGASFEVILLPVFVLYVLLACVFGLLGGILVNQSVRFLWHIAVRR